jgi:hypothetical protein
LLSQENISKAALKRAAFFIGIEHHSKWTWRLGLIAIQLVKHLLKKESLTVNNHRFNSASHLLINKDYCNAAVMPLHANVT